ncbi:MAG: CoA-binding protein [Ferruginibacter sp.]|nr:CoA-binding protein [Ferruginibacter sp.]
MSKKTLVIGASTNTERYSYLAINKLLLYKHEVVAIGLKQGKIQSVAIETELIPFENIDTITLYINPTHQKKFYEYILALKPKRVIFNPGTENEAFNTILQQNGIITNNACTLVMLSTYSY